MMYKKIQQIKEYFSSDKFEIREYESNIDIIFKIRKLSTYTSLCVNKNDIYFIDDIEHFCFKIKCELKKSMLDYIKKEYIDEE